jgi:adenine-specific DNA methylase
MFNSAGFAENRFRGCITSPERRSDHHEHNFREKKKQKNHTKETPRGGGLKRQKLQIQPILLAGKLPQHVQDIAVVSSKIVVIESAAAKIKRHVGPKGPFQTSKRCK